MKPLFSVNDLTLPAPPEEGDDGTQALHAHGGSRFVISMKGRDLRAILGELQHDEHVHVISAGQWSLHQMIAHILERIGPAKVWLATWTITEEPLRQLVELCSKKVITELNVLFDTRVKTQCPEAYQLAEANIANIRLSHCHAKCAVFINDTWAVSISCSANLTMNPRIEKYVICTHRNIVESDRDWIADHSARGQDILDE